MKTMKELYKALNIETDMLIEEKYETKENVQELTTGINKNLCEQGKKIEDLNQIVFKNNNLIIYWDLLNLRATMPSKRDEDAGFDIYTIENEAVLKPGETKFFSTGLRSAFPKNYWIEIKERGSTGAVGLSVRSGVIDSGYRGEWKIMLTNVNKYPVEFSYDVDKVTYIYGKIFKNKIKKVIYPLTKAIAQAVVIPLPNILCKWDKAAVDGTKSDRGETGWGASGK